MTQAHFWFWIMGYKTEYFEHNGYTIENDELIRENYLEKYASERKNKIINRFTGIAMKLNPKEKKYIKRFFEIVGYKRLSVNEYESPEKFRFLFSERLPEDQNSLESVEFETSKEFISKKTVKITDNLIISIEGYKGQIDFE